MKKIIILYHPFFAFCGHQKYCRLLFLVLQPTLQVSTKENLHFLGLLLKEPSSFSC